MNKTKKRICLLLTIVMILSLALPALAAPKIDKKVSLKKNKIITVYAVKGQTVQLKAAAGLKWTSSKKSVATVKKSGKNGIVTAKKKGTTTIQGVKGKTKYRCKFVVETPKINKASASISVGGSTTLKISGTKQKPKWSSSNEGVAIVSSSGVVYGIGQGTANIVANVGGAKYSCSVTVNQGVPTPAPGPMITATPIPTVTPIPTATPVQNEYGSVSGNITYLYNYYRGNVADEGSVVYLIPTDGSAKVLEENDYTTFRFGYHDYSQYGIYNTRVDGTGAYYLQHIPTGQYLIFIRSNKTTDGEWFNNSEDYYLSAQRCVESYLSNVSAAAFGRSVSYNKFHTGYVTVYSGEDTKCSYDFGITYN